MTRHFQKFFQRPFLGVLLAAAMGLFACYPLWEPRLPHGTDTLVHLYTSVQLDHLFQQGIFFSRWFPYKASGFGTPFFNYYVPLSYYAAQMFRLGLSVKVVTAMRLALGFSLVGAAAGMYLWVSDAFDKVAGLIAAAAYVWGPYMLYNTYFRGGLNEQYALLLMPWSLWALRRLAVTGQVRYMILAGLAYAGLILSHALTTLLFSPVLGGYALILALSSLSSAGKTQPHKVAPLPPQRGELVDPTPLFGGTGGTLRRNTSLKTHILAGPVRRITDMLVTVWRGQTWFRLGVAIGLGLGLSAFFWLPLIGERQAIHEELLYNSPEFDYHHNFVPPEALFLPLAATEARLALSVGTVALAGLGLLWLVWPGASPANQASHKTYAGRWEVGFVALVVGGYALMSLSYSLWLWDLLRSLLQFLQFPRRFLSVASLGLAFLAGAGISVLRYGLAHSRPAREQRLLGYIGTFLLPAAAMFLLWRPTNVLSQVRYYPQLPELDINFVMRKDREAGNIFNTYMINFIPATMQEPPPFAWLARDGPERLDPDTLPPEVKVLNSDYAPLRYSLAFSATQSFTATFNTFHFPGWQARLDERPVPILPTVPHGRISVAMPAGQHNLVVWFGSTPLRIFANGISLLALAGVVTLLVIGGRKRGRVTAQPAPVE